MYRCALYFFVLLASSVCASLSGNPGNPNLLQKGIWQKSSWCSVRVGYLDDWIYKYRFQDEFKIQGVTHTRTFLKFSTYAGIATLNFADRIDFYTQLGSSRMQLDDEMFSKRAFSWAAGSKLILYKEGNFFLGIDGKYFETDQKPTYFVIEDQAYNIATDYKLKYEEMQGSIGVAYKSWIFAPYANATYIFTRIAPQPPIILVQLPDMDELVDVEMKSIINKKRWGMALGINLIDSSKATLSFEWRAFNQNAINVNGELRF